MNDTNKLDILEIKPPLDLESGDGSSTMWWLLVVLLMAGAALLFWALHKPAQPVYFIELDGLYQHHQRHRHRYLLLEVQQ